MIASSPVHFRRNGVLKGHNHQNSFRYQAGLVFES
jgi:hypothetical protein